jgi:hypothetical protein
VTSAADPSFFARFFMAFAVFFRVLFDAAFAGKLTRIELPSASPKAEPEVKAPAPVAAINPAPKLREAPTDAALQLLGLLQREGRFIDFLQEDVSSYADADIGAAARVVHDQCKKALEAHVTLERIRSEAEGSKVTVMKGFSAQEVRLVGSVVGEAPFTGTLSHGGWRVRHVELPKLSEGHDVRVVAPAEVEL